MFLHPFLTSLRSCFLAMLTIQTLLLSTGVAADSSSQWTMLQSDLTARHEAGLVASQDALYLIGGRGIKPVEKYSPSQNSWQQITKNTPFEMHHFQPVLLDDKIYIAGGYTGQWPNETAITDIWVLDTLRHQFEKGEPIPAKRQRGAAGSVAYKGKLYLIGGITNGHMSGSVKWLDEYDPKSGRFNSLADAPIARDHFYAAVVNDKLYVIGGRKSSRATGNDFDLTVPEVDVYDFFANTWQTLPAESNLPTPRAGANVIVVGADIWVIGGESAAQQAAHAEVEVFDTLTQSWSRHSPLNIGRHSGGAGRIQDQVFAVTGSGNRGGSPELNNLEVIEISTDHAKTAPLFQTIDIDLIGPEASEQDELNPFTDYVQWTTITHSSGQSWQIRGYFAADGQSAFSSANAGNIWRSKFTPSKSGLYSYSSALYQGKDAAITSAQTAQNKMKILASSNGEIEIKSATKGSSTFDKNGFLKTHKGYFYFPQTRQYWLKGGSNSPENLLGFYQVDGTYRVSKQARDGEAAAGNDLHKFAAHKRDYELGDPVWGNDSSPKGQALIGAINYIAAQGLNTQYFLTMNINGDGQDVWPYVDHKTFDRFDISKLAQWEIIFQHMQDKGILLHLVTQETENETLLDNGNVERFRKLYYAELIARFAHHKGLVWNMGEENGPEPWTPIAQNHQQRIDMAAYFEHHDPYQHPILIHSHSTAQSKDKLLPPLYSSEYDGISFQVDYRQRVFEEISNWRQQSSAHAKNAPWLITMDEIGKWYTGARTDADDPTHESLRRHVLWPTFLAGGAGVEWYSGARQDHNDLGTEDFRKRHNLWQITTIARRFIEQHVPIWEMKPLPAIYDRTIEIAGLDGAPSELLPAASFYAANNETVFLAYVIERDTVFVDMPEGIYKQLWLDPISGKQHLKSDLAITQSGKTLKLNSVASEQDWVILLSKK